MVRLEHIPLRKRRIVPGVSALLLLSLISMEAYAQGEDESCPCFSYEEVETIFLAGAQLTAEEGETMCNSQDYSVEATAEVIVLDSNYETIAEARVLWYDFDPSRCAYIDIKGNPGVERKVSWPHPAPEAIARACFQIISRVIAKSDSSGKCNTYP